MPGLAEWGADGLGDLDIRTWTAVAAARGTPEPVARALSEAVRAAAAQPDPVDRLRPLGHAAQTSRSPAALAARVREGTPRLEGPGRASGARLDRTRSSLTAIGLKRVRRLLDRRWTPWVFPPRAIAV